MLLAETLTVVATLASSILAFNSRLNTRNELGDLQSIFKTIGQDAGKLVGGAKKPGSPSPVTNSCSCPAPRPPIPCHKSRSLDSSDEDPHLLLARSLTMEFIEPLATRGFMDMLKTGAKAGVKGFKKHHNEIGSGIKGVASNTIDLFGQAKAVKNQNSAPASAPVDSSSSSPYDSGSYGPGMGMQGGSGNAPPPGFWSRDLGDDVEWMDEIFARDFEMDDILEEMLHARWAGESDGDDEE